MQNVPNCPLLTLSLLSRDSNIKFLVNNEELLFSPSNPKISKIIEK